MKYIKLLIFTGLISTKCFGQTNVPPHFTALSTPWMGWLDYNATDSASFLSLSGAGTGGGIQLSQTVVSVSSSTSISTSTATSPSGKVVTPSVNLTWLDGILAGYLQIGTTNLPSLSGTPIPLSNVTGDGSGTNLQYAMRGVCVPYETNAVLSSATTLQIYFSPSFQWGDTNYTIGAPNYLAGVITTDKSSNSFTINFNSVTVTTKLEGSVIHK